MIKCDQNDLVVIWYFQLMFTYMCCRLIVTSAHNIVSGSFESYISVDMPKLVLQWRFFKPSASRAKRRNMERRLKQKLLAQQVNKKFRHWQWWGDRWHYWCDVSGQWWDQYGEKLYRRKTIWVEYDVNVARNNKW